MANDVEHVESFRLREIVEENALQTLLNSLTLGQIRSAIAQLVPARQFALKTHKEALEAILGTGKSQSDIRSALLDIECDEPFKNCLFVRMQGADVTQRALQLPLDGSVKSSKFGISLVYRRAFTKAISLTLAHTVEVKEWVTVSEGRREVRKNRVRHPIVVRLYAEQGIAALFYPGFSQGNATSRDATIAYEELLEEALKTVASVLDLRFIPLPIRECLRVFLDGANSRVRVVRSESDALSGRVSLASAAGQAKSVEEVLVDFLGPGLSADIQKQIMEAGRKALGTSVSNSVVLYWFKEQVVTRLKFWNIGTDMMFIWHGVPSTFRLVEDIVGLFYTTYQMLPTEAEVTKVNALAWLSGLQAGKIVRPGDVASELDLTFDEARKDLMQAMKIGLLRPVYRLRTSVLLLDTPNDWTGDLLSLDKEFASDEGVVIDGRDPRNIEVAFQRVDVEVAR